MKRKLQTFIFFFSLCLILIQLSSCQPDQRIRALHGNWLLENVEGQIDLDDIKLQGSFLIRRDMTFTMDVPFMGKKHSGSWELVRDQLILKYYKEVDARRLTQVTLEILELDGDKFVVEYNSLTLTFQRE